MFTKRPVHWVLDVEYLLWLTDSPSLRHRDGATQLRSARSELEPAAASLCRVPRAGDQRTVTEAEH